MSKARVAILFGGRSSEHSISCISAASVWESLDAAGYSVLPVALTTTSGMVLFEGSPADLRATAMPVIAAGGSTVVIPADPSRRGFLVDDEFEPVDVVFPVLHGPWGEDGTIQGLLELAGLPYVGSGVLASAICMDKLTLKTVLRAAGIAVTDWVSVDASSWATDSGRDTLWADIQQLGPVVFVKPSRAGSSMGISRVDLRTDGFESVEAAIELAREHDPRVLVEAAVVGAREIECGIRQLVDGTVESSVCAEIILREGFDFYDFDAKYVANGAELVVPADLSEKLTKVITEMAMRSFAEAGCEGLARVDFFVDGEEVVVSELNTMPGFTAISMFPRMWQESGVDYPELVQGLVEQALHRGAGLR